MDFLKILGIKEKNFGSSTGAKWNKTRNQGELKIYSPVNGKYIASVYQSSQKDYDNVIKTAQNAFEHWRAIPAPQRGEIVRQIGLRLSSGTTFPCGLPACPIIISCLQSLRMCLIVGTAFTNL